jgi:DNA modification methylase
MKIDIYTGDCLDSLKQLEDQSINTCITSPPYWGLRDYNGEEKQLGMEDTPEEFVDNLVKVFREVRRVLRDDGTVWLNLGDSYARTGGDSSKKGRHWDDRKNNPNTGHNRYAKDIGLKQKDLVGIPWRVALALQQDGWYLRQDIIWHKPNPMPESVQDRCTKAHEYIFLFSKSQKYYFDNEAIKEESVTVNSKGEKGKPNSAKNVGKSVESVDGFDIRGGFKDMGTYEKKNKRSVWTVNTKPFTEAHFATFPKELILPCVLAGCPEGGTVLDPFAGSGTTGIVANHKNRNAILLELSEDYINIAVKRIRKEVGTLFLNLNIIRKKDESIKFI